MTDGWTEDPSADGVVLIGDAAGWSEPTLGQGLSVSMRDVRIVSELLLANTRWDRLTFGGLRR
jgi:2-polyprenyl-6-methoxyphenol hydroxylase-like FAD-dependent oxidoreductase